MSIEKQADISGDEGRILESGDGEIFCLSIIGQIEGHFAMEGGQKATKYDHVIPTLVAVEESSRIKGVLILINTLGGDVEAGLAMAELIASMTKPTASIVLNFSEIVGNGQREAAASVLLSTILSILSLPIMVLMLPLF